jgi:hypothetical protein
MFFISFFPTDGGFIYCYIFLYSPSYLIIITTSFFGLKSILICFPILSKSLILKELSPSYYNHSHLVFRVKILFDLVPEMALNHL